MRYIYKAISQGTSSWSSLEGVTDHLERTLNSDAIAAQEQAGWELFQVQTLNDREGNNGFIFIFRRPTRP